MPLHYHKTLKNGLEIVVWKLIESLEELEESVSLNSEDKEMFQNISLPVKRREFLAGKYVLRKGCKELGINFTEMVKDEYGKPHLAGREYEISITHTEELIGVVFMKDNAVGVDLEKPRDQIFKILPRLYSQEEIDLIGDDINLASIFWSAKESLYKLYGKRGIDFIENLRVFMEDSELKGTITIAGKKSNHHFYITPIEDHFLVVAY